MKYTDRIYGEFEITEPVILELIQCPSIQRLKDIDQFGYRPLWVKPNVNIGEYDNSRFAHSLGVYLLLLTHKASLEEQIAGLIHDVSHSAFSHCIDYILDVGSEKEHTHQDNLFESYVKKTEIPKILEKFGYNLEYILDDKNFPLKEKNLPDLCADRIDYSLKCAVIFHELHEKDKNYLLENLVAENNNWIFKDFESAKKYAELFRRLNTIYWSGLPSAIMFRAVGDCLKYALQKGYISENDLYTTDKLVIEKVKKYVAKDKKLKLLWDRMNGKLEISNDPNNYDTSVFCKSRIVDPLFCEQKKILRSLLRKDSFKDNRTLKRLSEAEPSWSNIISQELKPKQYFLKFEAASQPIIEINTV